jgi:hypothetical protein
VTDGSTGSENGIRNLQTHLKLDFKEKQAIKLTLDKIHHRNIQNPMKNKIYLEERIFSNNTYIASFWKQKNCFLFYMFVAVQY